MPITDSYISRMRIPILVKILFSVVIPKFAFSQIFFLCHKISLAKFNTARCALCRVINARAGQKQISRYFYAYAFVIFEKC